MGVLGMMSPFIRDDQTKTNTSIHDLLQSHPTKTRIGLDMSIIIVSSLRSQRSTNIHNLFHSEHTKLNRYELVASEDAIMSPEMVAITPGKPIDTGK